YPRTASGTYRSHAASSGTTTEGERTTSGRRSMPEPAGSRVPGTPAPTAARARRQRRARQADPLGGRAVPAAVHVDRQDRHAVASGVVDEDLDRIEAHRLGGGGGDP